MVVVACWRGFWLRVWRLGNEWFGGRSEESVQMLSCDLCILSKDTLTAMFGQAYRDRRKRVSMQQQRGQKPTSYAACVVAYVELVS